MLSLKNQDQYFDRVMNITDDCNYVLTYVCRLIQDENACTLFVPCYVCKLG